MERNKFFSICSTPGVEQLYSKILLRNGVERSSGVGVDPYTQYKTAIRHRWTFTTFGLSKNGLRCNVLSKSVVLPYIGIIFFFGKEGAAAAQSIDYKLGMTFFHFRI